MTDDQHFDYENDGGVHMSPRTIRSAIERLSDEEILNYYDRDPAEVRKAVAEIDARAICEIIEESFGPMMAPALGETQDDVIRTIIEKSDNA